MSRELNSIVLCVKNVKELNGIVLSDTVSRISRELKGMVLCVTNVKGTKGHDICVKNVKGIKGHGALCQECQGN